MHRKRWLLPAGAAALLALAGLWTWARAQGEAYPPPALRGAVIAIDPGHGGIDGGAAAPAGGVLEKDLALQLAIRLRDELLEAGAVPVLTREADVDPSGLPWKQPGRLRRSLEARVETAVRARAVAFVSLHLDTSRQAREERRGPATFYGPQGAQDGRGRELAAAIQGRFHQAFGVDGRIYPLNALVLRANPVPSVLVECAFLNNPEDLARIRDPAYQASLAQAIAAGLGDYLRRAR